MYPNVSLREKQSEQDLRDLYIRIVVDYFSPHGVDDFRSEAVKAAANVAYDARDKGAFDEGHRHILLPAEKTHRSAVDEAEAAGDLKALRAADHVLLLAERKAAEPLIEAVRSTVPKEILDELRKTPR